jgi:ribosomal protein S18 acetylase RimI-like enzyme
MSTKRILIYEASEILEPSVSSRAEFQRWFPAIKDIIPPEKSKKYAVYSLFHLLGIFKNKKYRSYYSSVKNVLFCSFLVVPAYYRWSFMPKKSVQFTYVITHEEYRGKGIAWQGIYTAFIDLQNEGIDSFWYVTDSENLASQRLAEKMGFKLVSTAKKRVKMFGLIKILQLDEAK